MRDGSLASLWEFTCTSSSSPLPPPCGVARVACQVISHPVLKQFLVSLGRDAPLYRLVLIFALGTVVLWLLRQWSWELLPSLSHARACLGFNLLCVLSRQAGRLKKPESIDLFSSFTPS